jgi:glucose-1-phosphate cytidylyltransferase
VWSQGGKKIDFVSRDSDDWTITFVETGLNATIGERLKAVQPYLEGEEFFLANYGDGLSDLHLPTMIDELLASDAVASLLLVQPTASFDIVKMSSEGKIAEVSALSQSDIWINGGFFAFRKEIFDYINPGDELVREPFARLIQRQALLAHKCTSFWQCMDTFKDKQRLEELNDGTPPWKVWTERAAALSYQPAAKVA